MKKQGLAILLGTVLCPMLYGQSVSQSVTVTAEAGPDESISQSYMALDRDCRALVNKRTDSTQAITACKKVVDEADKWCRKDLLGQPWLEHTIADENGPAGARTQITTT